MGELSKKIIEEYRQARTDGDFATQAGILASLLQTIVRADDESAEIARDTAAAILSVRAK